MVQRTKYRKTGKEGESPPRQAPQKQNDVAQIVPGFEDHPKFNRAAKYQQKRGQREWNEHNDNEKQRP